MNLRLLLLICTFVLLAAGPVSGQVPFAIPEPPANEAESHRGEGIRVSGEWILSVYEPDGTFVEERTFHNVLSRSGADHLIKVLAGIRTHALWQVIVNGDPGPCVFTSGVQHPCAIVTLDDPYAEDPHVYRNLTIAPTDTTGDSRYDVLILRGSFTSEYDTEIVNVSTAIDTCEPSIAPADCLGSVPENLIPGFSVKILSPRLPVDVGQLVQVEVRISFN